MAGEGRGRHPNSLANLEPAPLHMTPEELKANAAKGGKASAEAKRQRKAMKELCEELISLPLRKGKVVEQVKSLAEAKGKNVTADQAIILTQIKKAIHGDTKAAEFLRDTMGEKPTNKQEIKATVETSPLSSILEQLKEGDDTDEIN